MPALVCTACGAPLPAEAAAATITCPFCGTSAAPPPRVVEHEVERVVERVVVRDTSGQPATLGCLRCGTSMREGTVDGMTASQCPSCGGAWVPAATAARLRERSSDDLRSLVARGEMLALARPPRATLACPVCKAAMKTLAMADTVHDVDVCAEHGTWFDRTEFLAFMDRETRRRRM